MRWSGRKLRLILVSALLVVSALVLSACGDGADEGGDGDTLSVWSWRTEDVAGYEAIFEEFERQTGIEAEFRPYQNTEYDTILETALQGGEGPDVMQLRAYGGLQSLVGADHLVPLGSEIDALEGFSEEALDGARGIEDGEVYGVPFATQTLQVFYNERLFEENGLEEPGTYEEFLEAAETLRDAGTIPVAAGGGDPWTLPILHSVVGASVYGGDEFVGEVLEGSKDFAAPEFVDSVEAVEELIPYFPEDPAGISYTDTQVLFTQEEAGMFVGGSFEAEYFQDTNPELELGTFPFPSRGDDALVSSYVDGSYGVNANSENREAALELAEFMASEEFGQMFVDELGQISPVPGVEFDDPLLAEMVADYEEASTPYMLLVYFRYGDPSGTDLLEDSIQNMMLGAESPDEAAQNLQRGVSQWYEPGELEEVGEEVDGG